MDCAPQEKYCVKVELLTGEVNRLCATEEKCKQDVKEPTANCCTEDKCNSSPRPSSPPPLLLSLLLLTLYSRRFFPNSTSGSLSRTPYPQFLAINSSLAPLLSLCFS